MKFLIVTHVVHTQKGTDFFAYSPYVNEMNIWLRHVNSVTIIAPLRKGDVASLQKKYNFSSINFIAVPEFSFINFKESIKAIGVLPIILWKLFRVMFSAQHIHLRCPGNMGLLGSLVQIFFPFKAKSAKYAGNWDPNAKQPLSYKFQKFVLGNTFFTHNMQVLVYGDWNNQTKNIKSFFTSTYYEKEAIAVPPKSLEAKIKFIFVGTLVKGKQPLLALQLFEKIQQDYPNLELSFYGEGEERQALENYITLHSLQSSVFLKGNQDRETMKEIYKNSHFLMLPSKSEGWPKVVAEAMFWGCLPIASSVSCVPFMLDFGKRGIVFVDNFEQNITLIQELLGKPLEYEKRRTVAMQWSRNFTLEKFEKEITKIVTPCE
ncbi:glycosyltransferase family 4 protein [Flavobacterium sp.]|uniref:glycosyltransferase family 4 protein n=1 Tax=Flavobacterium sp. TaxID=239 RepID=UPI003BDC8690